MIRSTVIIAAAVLLVPGLPLQAANKDIELLQSQVQRLQGQVADLQRQSDDTLRQIRQVVVALADQNEMLRRSSEQQQQQSEALQSKLSEISERLTETREQLQALARSSPLGESGLGSSPSGTPASPAPAAPAPRELYSQAYTDCSRGNYDLGIQEFQEFIKTFAEHDLADNAQYWIGECHYGKKDYAQAIEDWNTLFRDYPASDKLPDGRFKKGVALEKLGKRGAALQEYRYVVDHYPNSPAASKAREKLSPQ